MIAFSLLVAPEFAVVIFNGYKSIFKKHFTILQVV